MLIKQARKFYCDIDLGLDINDAVYALDAAAIELCFSLFDWAQIRRAEGAVKLHTRLDLRGNIPAFIQAKPDSYNPANKLLKLTGVQTIHASQLLN